MDEHASVDVQQRLDACARRWGLRVEGRLTGGHRSDVYACDGELVIKLTVTPEERATEAAALRAWDGRGAVPLLDVDEQHDALLLPRIRPATHLPGGGHDTAVQVAAGLLTALHGATSTSRFPTTLEAYDRHEVLCIRDATREEGKPDPIGVRMLPAARAEMHRLQASADREVLLHGDFIDKNLLLGPEGYVATDPIPRLGDPCSDIGFFAAYHPPASRLLDLAADVAGALGEDADRAVRWARVWAVGEACETWRTDSDDLQAVVAAFWPASDAP